MRRAESVTVGLGGNGASIVKVVGRPGVVNHFYVSASPAGEYSLLFISWALELDETFEYKTSEKINIVDNHSISES